jgi:hypothetical protein
MALSRRFSSCASRLSPGLMPYSDGFWPACICAGALRELESWHLRDKSSCGCYTGGALARMLTYPNRQECRLQPLHASCDTVRCRESTNMQCKRLEPGFDAPALPAGGRGPSEARSQRSGTPPATSGAGSPPAQHRQRAPGTGERSALMTRSGISAGAHTSKVVAKIEPCASHTMGCEPELRAN